ncbi:hypothetical protein ACMHYJ_02010 [Castellaniella hirudinis]|uniref:hypothetical protein n=1 Tax=Castellaniella hirudinis TaxID=1144617 RepID=UPI0039C3AD2C
MTQSPNDRLRDPMVTMRHVRQARMCRRGVKTWMELRGLDWMDFVRRGIPASALEATGDAIAIRVAALARAEVENG